LLIVLTFISAGSSSVYAQDVEVSVNGIFLEQFESPATVVNGRTMLPLRAILETIGGTLYWNAATSTVQVFSPVPHPMLVHQPHSGTEIVSVSVIPGGQAQLSIVTGGGANYVWVNFDRERAARASGRFAFATMVGQDASTRTWTVIFQPTNMSQYVEVGANRRNESVGASFHSLPLEINFVPPPLPPTPFVSPIPIATPPPFFRNYSPRFQYLFNISGHISHSGATVRLLDQNNLRRVIATQTSDSNGFFEFWDIMPGRYRVEASRFGYTAHVNVTVNNRDIHRLYIDLTPEPTPTPTPAPTPAPTPTPTPEPTPSPLPTPDEENTEEEGDAN
jgi:hypothetical protein